MTKLTAALDDAVSALAITVHAETPAEMPSSKILKVEKISVGTSVENRELSGEATDFPASVGRVYCWTKVTTATPPAKVTYLWYADGKKVADVPFDLKYPAGRLWSSKSVWAGQWKVEVVDADGKVASGIEFTVK